MKRLILWSLLIFSFCCVQAQQQTEYNRKGDEAMRRKDYRDAKMWYEEGVSYCDPYSINQLTLIWVTDANMHSSMGPVMNKCLNCLNNMAISKKDTLAMKKLILFYTDGIGTAKDENSANSWHEMLMQLRNPYPSVGPKKSREKMKFFIGFSSLPPVAPYGIQIGGTSAVGWYVRARTNMVFPHNDTALNGEKIEYTNGRIPVFDAQDEMYRSLPEIQKSMWMGTGGLIFKVSPAVRLSAGAGYVQYEETHEYEKIDPITSLPGERGRVINKDVSYRSVAIDADAMILLGKRFYGTVGCSVLNLKFIYPSAGIGIFFN